VRAYAQERAAERIESLAREGRDLVPLWLAANDVIASVVPHLGHPCWFTLDPVSLLATSHFEVDLPEIPPEWLAHEYLVGDVHSMAGVAQSPSGFSTLHDATGGDPSRSEAWHRYIRPYGGDQELLVALRTPHGMAWGVLGLYREPDRPLFSPDEIAFLVRVAPDLATGAQRALLLGEASAPDGPDAPGLVILDDDFGVESITAGTERWLDALPDGNGRRLPPAVLAVAGQARRDRDGAFARVQARDGRWLVLHGSTVGERAAVIVEAAHPDRISPLLMAAYGLTGREQDVTRLVLQGESTTAIATALTVSPHTVQQHLKRIFEKTGVRSRRELVGKVFFSHYEPRLRDNERRTAAGEPARGGPAHRAS
jgi:DNA-binding CsgD family transcriptional regulator